jgi:hypothetical protein
MKRYLLIFALLSSLAGSAQQYTTTTHSGFRKPTAGSVNWAAAINQNWDDLDLYLYSSIVHQAGTETIAGAKRFSSIVKVSPAIQITDSDGLIAPFQLLNGPNGIPVDEGPGQMAVPTFYPSANNMLLSLDLSPHGVPVDLGYGATWFDACTTDQIQFGLDPTVCLHLGAGLNPSGLFIGGAIYSGGSALPLIFGQMNGNLFPAVWNETMRINADATLTVAKAATFSSTVATPALALSSLAAPSCDVSHRGQFNYVAGGTGVKDVVQVCAKDGANAYAWRAIY